MPANATGTQTPRNPTITAVFPTKNGSGNFTSPPIDSKAFDTIQKNLTIGNRLLLKKSTKRDKTGNEYFFLEILPALDGEAANRPRKAKVSMDDI